MFLPDEVVKNYYLQIPGAEYDTEWATWIVPCSEAIPSFTVLINTYQAVVPGNLIKLEPITTRSSQCLGGIQSNMGIGVAIFGRVFLNSQYVVFDASKPQLGFAPQS